MQHLIYKWFRFERFQTDRIADNTHFDQFVYLLLDESLKLSLNQSERQ
jgi:hypothetical protein